MHSRPTVVKFLFAEAVYSFETIIAVCANQGEISCTVQLFKRFAHFWRPGTLLWMMLELVHTTLTGYIYQEGCGLEEHSMYRDPQRSEDRFLVGGETFLIRPYWPWGPPILLYSGYRVPFPGVNRPGRDLHHPSPSNAEVKESLQLYL
jgi:hypothetical protein